MEAHDGPWSGTSQSLMSISVIEHGHRELSFGAVDITRVSFLTTGADYSDGFRDVGTPLAASRRFTEPHLQLTHI